jgi:hypothetical protein
MKGDLLSLTRKFRAGMTRNFGAVGRAMRVGIVMLIVGAIAFAYALRSDPANHPVARVSTVRASTSSHPDPSRLLSIRRPLNFEINRGQTAHQVKYLAHSGDMALFLTADDAVLRLSAPRAL